MQVKPPDFDYERPASVPEAIAFLGAAQEEGKLLAGGQSLMPLLNFRLAHPKLLVDLAEVRQLQGMSMADGWLRIGAMTRTRALEQDPAIQAHLPLLSAAARWVGHVQIRNRGTIGGSLAHADPSAELPAVCLALDAEIVAQGSAGERVIAAGDFVQGFFTTALYSDEVLTTIRVALPPSGTRWGFREFAYRRGDFALAGAALALRLDAQGAVAEPRIAVFGTADRPVRATAAETALQRQRPTAALLDEAAGLAADEAGAEDPRPDAPYRRSLFATMVRRALDDALAGPDENWRVP